MLLAVEGGGFFSSSALGCSKGLTLLFLGHRSDDKPMRVIPLSQYHLVKEPESDPVPDFRLASLKKRVAHGFSSFVCFGCASAGIDSSSPLKIDPGKQQEVLPDPGDDCERFSNSEDGDIAPVVSRKSSLKRKWDTVQINVHAKGDCQQLENFVGVSSVGADHIDGKKVQWTDVCGRELAEIREFEPSETCGSEDGEDGGERSCYCVVM